MARTRPKASTANLSKGSSKGHDLRKPWDPDADGRPHADLPLIDKDIRSKDGDAAASSEEDNTIRCRLEAINNAANSDCSADSLTLYHVAFQEFIAKDGITSQIEWHVDPSLRSILERELNASLKAHKDRMVRAHVKALTNAPWYLGLLQLWGLFALEDAWPGSTLLAGIRDLSSAEHDAVKAHKLLKDAQAARAFGRQVRQLEEHRTAPRGKWRAFTTTDVREAIRAWIGQEEGRSWEDVTNYRKDKVLKKARERQTRPTSDRGTTSACGQGERDAEEQQDTNCGDKEAGDGRQDTHRHGNREDEDNDESHVPTPERGRERHRHDEHAANDSTFLEDFDLANDDISFPFEDTPTIQQGPGIRIRMRRSISESRASSSVTPQRQADRARSESRGPKSRVILSFLDTSHFRTPTIEHQRQTPAASTHVTDQVETEEFLAGSTMTTPTRPTKRPRLESDTSLQAWLDVLAPNNSKNAPDALLNHANVDAALVDATSTGSTLVVLRLDDAQLRTHCALLEIATETSTAHVNALDMGTTPHINDTLRTIEQLLRQTLPALASGQEHGEGEHTNERPLNLVALHFPEAQVDDTTRVAIAIAYKLASLDGTPATMNDFSVWQYTTALCAARSPAAAGATRPRHPSRPVLDADPPASIRSRPPFNLEASVSCASIRESVATWTQRADQLEQCGREAARIWEILYRIHQAQQPSVREQKSDQDGLTSKIAAVQNSIRQADEILARSSSDTPLREIESSRRQRLEERLLSLQTMQSTSARRDVRQAIMLQLANDQMCYRVGMEEARSGLTEWREEWKRFADSL